MPAGRFFEAGTTVYADETDDTVKEGFLSFEILDGYAAVTACSPEAEGALVIPETVSGVPVTMIRLGEGGASIFKSCPKLTEITIPSGMKNVFRFAFKGCTNLKKVIIEDGVESVGAAAFADTPWLAAKQAENPLVIVNSTLLDGKNCTGAVEILDGVCEIGADAFGYNDELTAVTIPASVLRIGNAAFGDCAALQSVNMLGGTRFIEEMAFYQCESLTSVTLPDTLEEIRDSAFMGCSMLNELQLPESLLIIESNAFADCGLTSIVLPEKLYAIGRCAFASCRNLSEIRIPAGFKEFGYNAFTGTAWLRAKKQENPFVVVNDILICADGQTGDVSVPAGVKGIGEYVFSCESDKLPAEDAALKSIQLPDSLEFIGDAAFENCRYLESVKLPDSLKKIDANVFNSCKNLETLSVPKGVTVLDWQSFSGCSALTSVKLPEGITIPKNVELVEDAVFSSARTQKLESITFMNPDCEIASKPIIYTADTKEKPFEGTIRGYSVSTAEAYAKKFGYKFETIGTPAETVLGDITGDSKVSIEDVQIALRSYTAMAAGLPETLTAAQKKAGDVTGDGTVSADDVLLMLKYYTENTVAGKKLTWGDLLSTDRA